MHEEGEHLTPTDKVLPHPIRGLFIAPYTLRGGCRMKESGCLIQSGPPFPPKGGGKPTVGDWLVLSHLSHFPLLTVAAYCPHGAGSYSQTTKFEGALQY